MAENVENPDRLRRPVVTLAGATTFHFVTDGIEAALERAIAAADGRDVRLGGGAATIQQFTAGRNSTIPLAAFVGVNLALLLLGVLLSLVVALIVWLFF